NSPGLFGNEKPRLFLSSRLSDKHQLEKWSRWLLFPTCPTRHDLRDYLERKPFYNWFELESRQLLHHRQQSLLKSLARSGHGGHVARYHDQVFGYLERPPGRPLAR